MTTFFSVSTTLSKIHALIKISIDRKLPGVRVILQQGPCASLTFNNLIGWLRLLN